MTKTWCFGGRHFSKSINQSVKEQVNPLTEKLVKFIRGKGGICGRNKSQTFTK